MYTRGESTKRSSRLAGRSLAEGGGPMPGRPTAMLRGDAHLREKQDAHEKRLGQAAEWFKRSGGDMQTLLAFQGNFMQHLMKEREADAELSATTVFKQVDTDNDGQLSLEDGGAVAELLQSSGHTTPVTYEHFKRLPAVAADSRKAKHHDQARMKKGPGKQDPHRGWHDLLKTQGATGPGKDGLSGWLEAAHSGGGKKMSNQDMHRGDAPLTSAEVEKIRNRLNHWMEKAEREKHDGAEPDTGQLGVLHEAAESLNQGLDRQGLKSMMEGLRYACCQALHPWLLYPPGACWACLPDSTELTRFVCTLRRDKMKRVKHERHEQVEQVSTAQDAG